MTIRSPVGAAAVSAAAADLPSATAAVLVGAAWLGSKLPDADRPARTCITARAWNAGTCRLASPVRSRDCRCACYRAAASRPHALTVRVRARRHRHRRARRHCHRRARLVGRTRSRPGRRGRGGHRVRRPSPATGARRAGSRCAPRCRASGGGCCPRPRASRPAACASSRPRRRSQRSRWRPCRARGLRAARDRPLLRIVPRLAIAQEPGARPEKRVAAGLTTRASCRASSHPASAGSSAGLPLRRPNQWYRRPPSRRHANDPSEAHRLRPSAGGVKRTP